MYLQLPISLPKITNFHLSTIILMFDKQKKNLLSFIINFFSEVNNLVFQDKTFLMYIKYNLKITNCPLIRVIVMKGCLWHISYNIVLSKTVELEQQGDTIYSPLYSDLYTVWLSNSFVCNLATERGIEKLLSQYWPKCCLENISSHMVEHWTFT